MIPYEDLVVAIERWRIRNGLPVGDASTRSAASAAPAPRPAVNVGSAPVRSAPPGPAPSTRQYAAVAPPVAVGRPATDLPVDLGDADVLEEELYGGEGDQGGYGAQVQFDDDDGSEKTSIGGVPGIFDAANQRRGGNRGVFDSYERSPEDEALDALDAGADVIDEASIDDDADLK
jgi:hypothetical protein